MDRRRELESWLNHRLPERNARKCCSELEKGSRGRREVCLVGDKLRRLAEDREKYEVLLLSPSNEVSYNLLARKVTRIDFLALRRSGRATATAFVIEGNIQLWTSILARWTKTGTALRTRKWNLTLARIQTHRCRASEIFSC